MSKLDDYYLNKQEPVKSCLLSLRSIILQQDVDVTETRKYGMPCFCYKNMAFCYLWTDKKTNEPYVLFVEGKYLEAPELEEGNRSRMKIFRVNPNADIVIDKITSLLNSALGLYRNGIVKTKK